jgi:hypothetical protein
VTNEASPASVHAPAAASAPVETHDLVLALQQRIGNQATMAALGERAPAVDAAIAGGGRPLDAPVRREMEQRFNEHFDQVRVHTDDRAARSARSLDAKAYTVGHDIAFGEGRFSPQSSEGKHLLAHELAHVVQQGRADRSPGPTSRSEGEARRAAAEVSAGRSAPPLGAAPVGVAQCAPEEESTKPKKSLTSRVFGLLPPRVQSAVAGGVPIAETAETLLSPETRKKVEQIVSRVETLAGSSRNAGEVVPPSSAPSAAAPQGGIEGAVQDLRRQVQQSQDARLTAVPAPFAAWPTGPNLRAKPQQVVLTPALDTITKNLREASADEIRELQYAAGKTPEEVRKAFNLTPAEFEVLAISLRDAGGDRRHFIPRPDAADEVARRVLGLGPGEVVTQGHLDQVERELVAKPWYDSDFNTKYHVDSREADDLRRYFADRRRVPDRLKPPPSPLDPNAPVIGTGGVIVKESEYEARELALRIEAVGTLTHSPAAGIAYGLTKYATDDEQFAWQVAGATSAVAGAVGAFGGRPAEPVVVGAPSPRYTGPAPIKPLAHEVPAEQTPRPAPPSTRLATQAAGARSGLQEISIDLGDPGPLELESHRLGESSGQIATGGPSLQTASEWVAEQPVTPRPDALPVRNQPAHPQWHLSRADEANWVQFSPSVNPRAGWRSAARFSVPQGGGTFAFAERSYVFDANRNLTEASTTKLSLGVRDPAMYADAPDIRHGEDFGHLLGPDFGHIDAQLGVHGGFPQTASVNRPIGGAAPWYAAERTAKARALELDRAGVPYRVVGQGRGHMKGIPAHTRIFVESNGQVVFDSGWIANPAAIRP